MTIGLLLAAAATLVVGFVERSLPLDYVSIAASAVCVVVLVVFTGVNRAKRRQSVSPIAGSGVGAGAMAEDDRSTELVPAVRGPRVLLGRGRKSRDEEARREEEAPEPAEDRAGAGVPEMEPLAQPWPVRRSFFASGRRGAAGAVAPERQLAGADELAEVELAGADELAGAELAGAEDAGDTDLDALPEPAPARRSLFRSIRRPATPEPQPPVIESFDPDAVFPIADYDELRVSEILPLLSELVPDEYEMVRRREVAGRGRATILRRLDELSSREQVPVGATVDGLGSAPYGGTSEPGAVGLTPEEPEIDLFPIADYDDLRVSEILPLLRHLDRQELEMVRHREEAGAGRATVLRRIDTMVTSMNGRSGGAVEGGGAAEDARVEEEADRAAREPDSAEDAARARERAAAARAYQARKAAAASITDEVSAAQAAPPPKISTPASKAGGAGVPDDGTLTIQGGRAAAAKKTGATKAAGTKAAGTKAAGTKAAGTKAAGTKAAGTKAAGTKAAGTKAAGTRAAGTRAAGTRAAGTKAAGTRAAGTRAAGTKGAGPAGAATTSPVEASPTSNRRRRPAGGKQPLLKG